MVKAENMGKKAKFKNEKQGSYMKHHTEFSTDSSSNFLIHEFLV